MLPSCVLVEDCNQQDYTKLAKALCADHGVGLFTVPSAKTLDEWAELCNISKGKEGESWLLLYNALYFLQCCCCVATIRVTSSESLCDYLSHDDLEQETDPQIRLRKLGSIHA
ncbi:hypothetical protein SADUNF_Sadunf01G0159000 [Salix dunnii]|uniref:Ribosomal protein eL8/eL30/eS12/Gadd45 domain-containing protein n=1 Tax=Salix dunnii TaxID=1413687 RepID=A0A835NC46_9ROSI|nr:hypothetical protein SADUNF_Sadunf01G0159000 [Salix dunnii]